MKAAFVLFGLALLSDNLSPRANRLVDIANHLVLAGFLAFLLVYAWRNMILMHPRLIGATQMHASLIHSAMVVGLALLLRTMLVALIRLIRAPLTEDLL